MAKRAAKKGEPEFLHDGEKTDPGLITPEGKTLDQEI